MFLRGGGGGMYRREPSHYEFAGGLKYCTVRPMYAISYPKGGMKVRKNAACGQGLTIGPMERSMMQMSYDSYLQMRHICI